jgi:hypothetical protein
MTAEKLVQILSSNQARPVRSSLLLPHQSGCYHLRRCRLAPPEIIEEFLEAVADAQPTEGRSQVVSEPAPDSSKDSSPASPISLGNEVESWKASNVKSDAAVESLPASPAADANPPPIPNEGQKPTEDAVVQPDESSKANLPTAAGETKQVADAAPTTSEEPAPAPSEVNEEPLKWLPMLRKRRRSLELFLKQSQIQPRI